MSNFNSPHGLTNELLSTQNEPETPDVMSYIIRGKDAPSRWPISRDSLIDDAMTMQVSHLPPNIHASCTLLAITHIYLTLLYRLPAPTPPTRPSSKIGRAHV